MNVIHGSRLILIAGAACTGKSTLIEALMSGKCPSMAKQLDLGDPKLWTYLVRKKEYRFPQSSDDRLMMHYDISYNDQPWKLISSRISFEGVECLKVLPLYEQITFVTLYAPNQKLIKDYVTRGIARNVQFRKMTKFRENIKHLQNSIMKIMLYINLPKLRELYCEWFNYCQSFPSKKAHWIINSKDINRRLQRLDEWSNSMKDAGF